MLDTPFRGSAAVAAGLVTRDQLRGPRFRRLFRDVYVAAHVEPELAVRARAAALTVARAGVLGGWAAAELLGASCAPRDAPVEVILPSAGRGQPGLRIRRDRLGPGEIVAVYGVRVTSPVRTIYDLGRRSPLVEAVVAVDALARAHPCDLDQVLRLQRWHLGGRGSAQLPQVLSLADPRAESPMETRIRVDIVLAGLPAPRLQYPVGPYRLDLAYPEIRLGIEYDGREHREQARALRDLNRQSYLTAAGWTTVLRFTAAQVYRPLAVADRVHQELMRYGRRRDLGVLEVIAMIDSSAA